MRDAGRESRVPAGPFLVVGNDFELLDRRGAVYPEVALVCGHTGCWPLFAIRSILLVGILTKQRTPPTAAGYWWAAPATRVGGWPSRSTAWASGPHGPYAGPGRQAMTLP